MADKSGNVVLSVVTRLVVSLVLLMVAVLVFAALYRNRPEAASVEDVAAPPRVLVMALKEVAIRREWRGFGTARAMDSANVPSEVEAIVDARPVHIQPGAHINQGDLIVKLDDSDFMRQVEFAQQAIAEIDAELAQIDVEESAWKDRAELAAEDTRVAEAELARVEEALRRSAAKEREVDLIHQTVIAARRIEIAAREELQKVPVRRARFQALRAQQESQLKLAQQNQERCTITSPIAGVLQAVDVEVGESVTPGTRVARVVSLSRIEVPVRLPASARRELKAGDNVTLLATGSSASSWTAQLARIAPEDDETSRTVTVYAELTQDAEAEHSLAPGRFVEAEVASVVPHPEIAIPRRALSSERIAIVEDGLIRSLPIEVKFHFDRPLAELGLPDEQWVIIESDLPEGTLVVLNRANIREGQRVEPVLVTEVETSQRGTSEEATP